MHPVEADGGGRLEIVITRPIETRFHRQLITREWLDQLREFLSSTRLHGIGRLHTEFGEERYRGPESVVKYRFHVIVNDEMPHLSPIQTGESAFVEYQPKRAGFKLLGVWWWLEWRADVVRHLLPKACRAVGDWKSVSYLLYKGLVSNDELAQLLRTYSGVPVLEGDADLNLVRTFRRERGVTAMRVEDPAIVVAVSEWDQKAFPGASERPVSLRVATPEQVEAIQVAAFGQGRPA